MRSEESTRTCPWSASTIRDIGFVVAGIPLSLAAPAILDSATLFLRHKVRSSLLGENDLLAAAIGIIVPVVAVLAFLPALSTAQGWRFSTLAGIDLERPATLGQGARWRQGAYHLVVGPALEAVGLACAGLFGLGLALSTAFCWMFLAHGSHPVQVKVLITLAGIAILFAAPWAIAALRRLDSYAATDLLGQNRTERLLAAVTKSRSGLAAAADAERRRIERDLHDGTQARLVSLAINLGLAGATVTGLPEARQVIADAHDEAIKAIDDLRHLLRGLHPAVLDELGLDAALSGLAARTSLPVSLRVEIDKRVSPTVEAVAYFVVSEAMTNTVRHASANCVDIAVERIGDVLRVRVTDDGVGGADPAKGSGIYGLAQRVSSADGTFQIHSPPGGPTTIVVELPCAS